MTTEVLSPAPPYAISTAGPYAVPHPYQSAADLVVTVTLDETIVRLNLGEDYTVAPLAALKTGGNLTLTAAALTAYAGWTLAIARNTVIEQGWQGIAGPREKGLERQLDRMAQAMQDLRATARRALILPLNADFSRIVRPPGPGETLVGNSDGTGFTAGPTVEDIAAAQAYAAQAKSARDAALATVMYSLDAFGAQMDGVTDDRAALSAAMAYCRENGYALRIPGPALLINSLDDPGNAVMSRSDKDLTVFCDARIIAGPALDGLMPGIGNLIRVQTDTYADDPTAKFQWFGGKFDLSRLERRQFGITGLSIGPRFGTVICADGVNDHGVRPAVGADIGSGGGDQSIFCIRAEHFILSNWQFRGAPDLGIYLSAGDEEGQVGSDAAIVGCSYYRCANGVGAKRNYKRMTIALNHFEENENHILMGKAGSSLSNHGKRAIITGNWMIKAQGNPINVEGNEYLIITGNAILDYRRWISDGVTATEVSSGNPGGAIRFAGCKRCVATGNILGFEEWEPPAAPQAAGVALMGYTNEVGTASTRHCVVTGNLIQKAFRAFLTTEDSANNLLTPNLAIECLNPDDIRGSNNALMPLLGDSDTGIEWLSDNAVGLKVGGRTPLRVFGDAGADENWIGIFGTRVAEPPYIRPNGPNANEDLWLRSKGAGLVRFGQYTAGAVADTGSVLIRLDDGRSFRVSGEIVP